eukprot:CAMPEP_0180793948 /NCGR_PEP_ID=MMETSP1038_2-20121128/55310_1 /TAXON_ID=632150 /ORGANISM="Azadinium spinosum, Strain 3D9" /LENGTH=55 /DNA_ID=CAMNT_0022832579 /DNA_START=17 /DNA_END=181 /DNA_ORIENTATION=-
MSISLARLGAPETGNNGGGVDIADNVAGGGKAGTARIALLPTQLRVPQRRENQAS